MALFGKDLLADLAGVILDIARARVRRFNPFVFRQLMRAVFAVFDAAYFADRKMQAVRRAAVSREVRLISAFAFLPMIFFV